MKSAYLIPTIFVLSIQFSCAPEPKFTNNLPEKNKLIDPPFPKADIPYEINLVNAEKGDTLFFNSGAVIVIPPNAVLDEKGKLITGNVRFKYREFLDPLDIYLSGIPMTYEHNDNTLNFESVYMCDVQAFQNNRPLKVNPEAKPKVYVPNSDSDTVPNLYYLDTLAEKWVQEGKVEIIDILSLTQENKNAVLPSVLDRPIKPHKSNGERPVFYLDIDSTSVPELLAYSNLEFEIDERDTNYNYQYSKITWTDVDIHKSEMFGLYNVRFRNPKQQVTFLTRPVIKGKNYDEALEIFEERQRLYDRSLKFRQEKEEDIRKRNERILQINRLIDEAEIARKEYLENLQKSNEEKEKDAFLKGGNAMKKQIIRSFEITNFGMLNDDKFAIPKNRIILAKFKDNQGQKIPLKTPTVVYKGLNGLFPFKSNNIELSANMDQMIWGVVENKFVYLTYEDFKLYNLKNYPKEVTFTMRIHEGEITSREEIREILKPSLSRQ